MDVMDVINSNDDKELIDKIIALEWEMFVSVNEGEDKASCQEDYGTFLGMREAQFSSWSAETAASYLSDLETAQSENRNLIEAKYIHMMKPTEPSKYEALIKKVKVLDAQAEALAREVSDLLLEQTRILFEDYPYVAGQGRPLYSTLDYAAVSIETYQLGELLTYSAGTLTALKEHIISLSGNGVSLARLILEKSVGYYGYASLDKAEAATKERAEKMGIQVSFGCCPDGECDVEF